MNVKNCTFAALLLAMPVVSVAAPSINDMQSCQGLLDYIDEKLDSAPARYPAEDIKIVRKGLDDYDQYIQQTIVTPGLLAFNSGDAAKADAMQAQVDAYKQTLVSGFHKRYKGDVLYMDQAIAVNNCAKKAVPSGQALENLKASLNTIVKLSKM